MVLVLMALITFFSFFGVESFKETASTFSQLKENMDAAEALIEVTLCLNSILAHDLMNLCVLYRFHIKKNVLTAKVIIAKIITVKSNIPLVYIL